MGLSAHFCAGVEIVWRTLRALSTWLARVLRSVYNRRQKSTLTLRSAGRSSAMKPSRCPRQANSVGRVVQGSGCRHLGRVPVAALLLPARGRTTSIERVDRYDAHLALANALIGCATMISLMTSTGRMMRYARLRSCVSVGRLIALQWMPLSEFLMRPADLTLDLLGRGERATLRVQGRSMWPTLIEGDRVVIAPRDEYQVGDLLAFDVGKPSLTVHRLLQKEEGRLRTRGDGMVRRPGSSRIRSLASWCGWSVGGAARSQPVVSANEARRRRRRWRRRIDDADWSLLGTLFIDLSDLAQTACSFCSDHHLDTD